MIVELGTPQPIEIIGGQERALPGPAVVWAVLGDGGMTFNPEVSGTDVALALIRGQHLPDNELLVDMLSPNGWWRARSASAPDWVWSDNVDMQRILADFFGCSQGQPADVEARYWTRSGPPGTGTEGAE